MGRDGVLLCFFFGCGGGDEGVVLLQILLRQSNDSYFINYYRYYSLYGHVDTMAREVHRGAASVEGVEATLWHVSYVIKGV